MTTPPTFPYFDDPIAAGSFKASQAPCACCNNTSGWIYAHMIYSERDNDSRVCPGCIADGSAAAMCGGRFNTLARKVDDEEASDQVRKRTPSFATWQGLEWPVCCEKPCVFRGYAQYEELTTRWPAAGEALKATYQKGWLGTETADEFLQWFKSECDPAAYAFQCATCDRFHVPWDIS